MAGQPPSTNSYPHIWSTRHCHMHYSAKPNFMDHCPLGLDPPYWRFSTVPPYRWRASGRTQNLALCQTAFLHPWSRIWRKDQGGRKPTHWFKSGWYSFSSYCSPSARWRANYSVLVCLWHRALHLYYCRICCDFDTGLPPTQASERRSRDFQQMHVRHTVHFPTW